MLTRAHIHSHVINCLREEGVNMQDIEVAIARCDYWVNDWIKRMKNASLVRYPRW